MNKFNLKQKILLSCSVAIISTLLSVAVAVEYPENRDYGNRGEFIAKRGTEFGRTAILMPVGPILINLPEGPGTSSDTFLDPITGEPIDGVLSHNRARDTAWDLSDLTDPKLYRQLTCDTDDCNPGQPIAAHATVVRFEETLGPILYGRNSGNLSYHADLKDQAGELNTNDNFWQHAYAPIAYLHMSAPYFLRNYWQYGYTNDGQYVLRDTSKQLPDTGTSDSDYTVEGDTELEMLFGTDGLGVWLGEPIIYWDHLGLTGVTGFPTWLGNLLIVSSDQQSTGIAIYDMTGYKEERLPSLLSVYNEQRTEPSGNKVGVGGYWLESYGTTKMVYAARQRAGIDVPRRENSGLIIIDFLDPENPYVSCELYFDQDENDPTDGDASTDPMYVNFQDEFAYLDHFQVNIPLCEQLFSDGIITDSEFDQIVYKFDDIANHCDSSQYFRPIGQVGIFGGYDWWQTDDINEQGMCFFVTSDQPDTRPPFVAGHRPLANEVDVSIDTFIHIHIPETLRTETVENSITIRNKSDNSFINFEYQLAHTGLISIWPDSYLASSTTYEVTVSGIQDFMGNTLETYLYEFTTDDGDLVSGTRDGQAVLPVGTVPEVTSPIPTYNDENIYFANKSSQIHCPADNFDEDIWVVNPDNDTISIISQNFDLQSLTKNHQFERELRLNYETPTSIIKVNEQYAITFRDDDKVVFYSSNGMPEFSLDMGHGTQPISLITDGTYVYVALYASGEIVKIDPNTKQILSRLNVGSTPKAMAMTTNNDNSSSNRLLVTRFISATNYGEVYDINTDNDMTLTRTITVNEILVSDDIDHGSGIANYLRSIVISDDNQFAYITAKKDNTNRGTRPSNEAKEALDSDNTVRSIVITLDLLNNVDANIDPTTRDNTLDLDNVADPSGITYLANPHIRAIAFQGNNTLLLSDMQSNTTVRMTVGNAPQEVCSNLRTLYVKNFTDRTMTAIDIASYLNNGDLNTVVETISTVTNEVLTTDELTGLQLFYHSSIPEMGPEGYMSCASCHDGGGHDGRTWDLTAMGEGLRNTISLNGTSGTRFGNLHWSGNFDEVQDFEIQMERLNGGTGLIPETTFTADLTPLSHTTSGLSDDLDALAAYVNGLGKDKVKRSPFRSYNGDLTESAANGQTIFTEKNCTQCHTGDSFRDGLMHDVGTIRIDSGSRLSGELAGIRTPTLIELWDSAPYFHDGSAETLSDVLHTGSDADHAVPLTTQEETDLITYLLSIDRELYIDDQ